MTATVSASVAGSWINGAAVVTGGANHQVINPANGDVVAELALATPADVDTAVEVARQAQRGWGSATPVDRASDADIVALLLACRSARDRLIVLLMSRVGLRRGELCGLRRSDVHLLLDSRVLGCQVDRAHVHVMRRDNPNGAWAKSRRQRAVPVDHPMRQAIDQRAGGQRPQRRAEAEGAHDDGGAA